jgi:hypothetical protein
MTWFKTKYPSASTSTNYEVPNVEVPGPSRDLNDVYTIGNNLNGDTIINLKSGYTSMVLTLTPPEVNRMVRLLLATLESDEIEDRERNERTD